MLTLEPKGQLPGKLLPDGRPSGAPSSARTGVGKPTLQAWCRVEHEQRVGANASTSAGKPGVYAHRPRPEPRTLWVLPPVPADSVLRAAQLVCDRSARLTLAGQASPFHDLLLNACKNRLLHPEDRLCPDGVGRFCTGASRGGCQAQSQRIKRWPLHGYFFVTPSASKSDRCRLGCTS